MFHLYNNRKEGGRSGATQRAFGEGSNFPMSCFPSFLPLFLTMKGNETNPNSAYKSFAACCSFSPVVGTKRVVTSREMARFRARTNKRLSVGRPFLNSFSLSGQCAESSLLAKVA